MFYSEGKKKIHELTIDDGLKIIDVIKMLNVPTEQINIILKNGQQTGIESLVSEGDEIEVKPIIAGG